MVERMLDLSYLALLKAEQARWPKPQSGWWAAWHKIRRWLGGLALGLVLTTSAHAGENFYEYLGIQILEPKTCTSPCHVTWRVELRGLPLLPLIKRCPGGPEVELDEYLTIYASGANLPQGTIRLTIGDTHPWDDMHPQGRSQTYCARLIFSPLPPE